MQKVAPVFHAALLSIAGALPLHATPEFVTNFGGTGSGPGQLDNPTSVVAAPDGTLYVSDTDNSRISVFSGNGQSIGNFGTSGDGPGQIRRSYGVAVSPDGTRVLVGDYDVGQVQVFDREGGFIRRFFVGGRPTGLEELADGRIVVGDAGAEDRFSVFSGGGSLLAFLEAPGGFETPWGVATFPDERIVVADAEHSRCIIYSPAGELIRTFGNFGVLGTKPGQFATPAGVAVASDGSLFVSDSYNHNVQIFSDDGTFRHRFGSFGSGPGQFGNPTDIAVLPNGMIYVADSFNDRIVVFHDPDVKTRPTVKIRGKKKIKTTRRIVKLKGKAGAAHGTLLKKVYIKVDGKSPKAVGRAGKWSYKLRLKNRPAATRVKVYSIDQLGQKSKVSRVKVIRKP